MLTRPPYLSIMLISASALAFEILLMRLFSIIQWHHFAYMMIALALLGYGVSGTIVSIFQSQLLAKFKSVYVITILLFSLTAVFDFLVAQSFAFNAEAIFWDWRQLGYLVTIFLLLMIPFFFAATAICLAFMNYRQQVSSVYAMDLFGAGLGSLGIIGLLYLLFPQSVLLMIGGTGLLAALLACWELKVSKRLWISCIVVATVAVLLTTVWQVELKITPYKSLPQTMQIEQTQIIEQRSSPLGLLSVVESRVIPFRYAPGLSLNAEVEPLKQLGVFTDGDNMTVITQYPDQRQQLAYLDQMTSALPYHLRHPLQVLIIGAGGGTDVLQAKYHKVPDITAVELNKQLIDLLNNKYGKFSGGLYQQPGVQVYAGDARGFLTKQNFHYDLIQLAMVDAFNASSSGLYALNESYLYTTEALQLYLQRLKPEGYLAISRWIKIPPRDTLKLFTTAVAALKQSGIKHPERHLVLIRSWQTSTLLVKKQPFTEMDHAALQQFCDERLFDIAYSPNITKSLANRYNQLQQPFFYSGAKALLGEEKNRFFQQYKFYLQPATDDQPYFHHFFKWSTISEVMRLREKGGMPLIEWGYVVLIATLVIALLLSTILIMLPLYFKQRFKVENTTLIKRRQVMGYFFTIGLAFLFIEIAFMQKFILFLHHPIYSISVTLTAFLVFAGLGSNWSSKISQNHSNQKTARWAISGIVVLAILYLLVLEPLFASLVALPLLFKIVITIILIAPLAFFMGMPFPMALATLAEHAQDLIPWAWSINGCASVVSVVLATLLAIHFGFMAVIVIAILLYIVVLFIFPKPEQR